MPAYRVMNRTEGSSFYLLAPSPAAALEIVALKIGNGASDPTWDVTAEHPKHPIKRGVIVNVSGDAVTTFTPADE